MKNFLLLGALIYNSIFFSQAGKVGVNTTTPTETLDIKGTLRIRSLPNSGDTNAIYTTGNDTNSGTSPTQTFTATNPLMADANGVLGYTSYSNLISNNTSSNFNTDNSPNNAMFVVKRFTITDTVGGATGTYNNATGFDTGMSSSNWQAIMSNIMFTFTTATTGSQFINGNVFSYRLRDVSGTWRVVGDITNIQETAFVDILFIKSNLVAADARTN